MRIPVVLDLVVCPPRQVRCNCRPPVAQDGMEAYDHLLFLRGEFASLDVRPEIIRPSETTAFPASKKSSVLGKSSPAPVPMLLNVGNQLLILVWCPRTLLHTHLFAARSAPHFARENNSILQLSVLSRISNFECLLCMSEAVILNQQHRHYMGEKSWRKCIRPSFPYTLCCVGSRNFTPQVQSTHEEHGIGHRECNFVDGQMFPRPQTSK